MRDERPWGADKFVKRLAELAVSEPDLQVHLGMQRQCEHDLVVNIAKDVQAAVYVEIGSGNGKLLYRVKAALPEATVIGFEISAPQDVIDGCASKGIEVRSQDVLADGGDSLEAQVKELVEASTGPVFVYTDNGNKPLELRIVSEHMRVGDVCGSHDFSGPDWGGFVRFLQQRNFATMVEYESYILDHLCLQRFWKKQQEAVTEGPCEHCV